MSTIDYGFIEVDFKKLDKAISEIEKYIKQLKKNMMNAQDEVNLLLQRCQGPDFAQFKNQWDMAIGEGSTYSDFCKALESYVSFLKYVKIQYKYMQSRAINRADSL